MKSISVIDGAEKLSGGFKKIWTRRLPKSGANGVHGIVFYGLEFKKQYYPTRKDEEAVNPDGTGLR